MPPRVAKPDRILDLGPVDCDRLAAMVARVSERTWSNEDSRKENNFAVFHHTQHIVFRFISGNRDPSCFYENPAWAMWRPLLEPVMNAAVSQYGFRRPVFAKAMLARLLAGHVIDSHSDGAGSNERCHKIHVPLLTNPDARVFVAGRSFHLPVGRAFEINNTVAHGAANRGADHRVHFIFEVFEGDFSVPASQQISAAS